ncbi:uncharacterized protein [Spinacia oleracea]|uniref:Integrase catalytic domain-containing protein n=1 Tax=Spinacia oleracea TaxID=3562 RepID=A0ABM3QZ84_SPIOL|nr:uncharacterized protein LOC130463533 [Spinacia oleracea]
MSKLASSASCDTPRQVFWEVKERRSIEQECNTQIPEVDVLDRTSTWMDDITAYKIDGTLPDDSRLAARIQKKTSWFEWWNGGTEPYIRSRSPDLSCDASRLRKGKRFGIPRSIVFDNGPQFEMPKLKEWQADHGIHSCFASVGRPQANGQADSVSDTAASPFTTLSKFILWVQMSVMDRKWMHAKRCSDDYKLGVEDFISFAIEHVEDENNILCPCVECNNMVRLGVDAIRDHLITKGINQLYKCWLSHGEILGDASSNVDTGMGFDTWMEDETHEEFMYDDDGVEEMINALQESIQDCPEMLENLSSDAKKPLYNGCSKFSRLSGVLKLLNIKASNGVTNKCFFQFMEAFHEILPDGNLLPSRTYDAKKMLTSIGLGYERIHACPNDCILYRKEYASLESFPECHVSRYKQNKVPAKVMWYFPIIPRFRRLFSVPEEAKNLTWHVDSDGREKDGMLRHPADSPQWVKIDKDFPDFGAEPRNLRLALATDGMNPHDNQRSTHSTWPVILMIYNLPPTLCMKRMYMMLSTLISGPKQPGHDIDVYLAPLVEDLKLLWESGVEVFDAHHKEYFNLKAMLFGTINDFPAYGNLSGYSVKGYNGCPICDENTSSIRIPSSNKIVYMIFKKVQGLNVKHGKLNDNQLPSKGYKKKSILFGLPYWKNLYVRHFLDVMHIEKNICESLVGTLLNMPGKSKDGENARYDLEHLKIRKELHPVKKKGTRTYLPPACYTLSRKEKKVLCESLHGIKVPERYSSNIKILSR